jgi:hypothetical protein
LARANWTPKWFLLGQSKLPQTSDQNPNGELKKNSTAPAWLLVRFPFSSATTSLFPNHKRKAPAARALAAASVDESKSRLEQDAQTWVTDRLRW